VSELEVSTGPVLLLQLLLGLPDVSLQYVCPQLVTLGCGRFEHGTLLGLLPQADALGGVVCVGLLALDPAEADGGAPAEQQIARLPAARALLLLLASLQQAAAEALQVPGKW
jgi:hypothetical protein